MKSNENIELTVIIKFSSGVLARKFYIFKANYLKKSPRWLKVDGSRLSTSSKDKLVIDSLLVLDYFDGLKRSNESILFSV